MTTQTTQRLSASSIFDLLGRARQSNSAALARIAALTQEHQEPNDRRLIAAAFNLQPYQLRLDNRQLEHEFYDDVLFGIRARAQVGNLDLLLLNELPERVSSQVSHYAEICRQYGVEGIILVSFDPQDHEVLTLTDGNLPLVAIDTQVIGARASFVTSDNVGGAIAAVKHLQQIGRTHIAFVGGAYATETSRNRRLGYESGLQELGLEIKPEYILETDWRPETARRLVAALLATDRPPDAFFCASDELALGVMLAVEQAGLRIPEDIAVVGFDDSELARGVSPSLSSVRQDRIGLGGAAVEALLGVLTGPGSSLPTSILPTELIVRESSAPRVMSNAKASKPLERQPHLSIESTLSLFTPSGETSIDATGELGVNKNPQAKTRQLIAISLGLTPDQSLPRGFLHALFLAIRAQAFERGIDLLLLPSIDMVQEEAREAFLGRYNQLVVQGIIILSGLESEQEIITLAKAGCPCVTAEVDLLGDRVAFVTSDNIGGATQAIKHLAAIGRKRIAFIGGEESARSNVDRYFGFQSEMGKLGLAQRPEYVAQADWQPKNACEAVTKMIALPEPPDAIFCASDVMAIGAMVAIERAGLHVPDDIAVVGFDDIYYAEVLSPSLTTVRQDRNETARAIMDAMLQLIEHPNDPPTVSILPVELVVRESSG